MSVLEELLVAIGLDADGLADDAEQAASGVSNKLKGIAAAGAGIAVGMAFHEGLQSAMDITAVTTKLTNQLGLTEQEASRVGTLSGDVFAAGFGESVDQVGEALAAVSSTVGDLGTDSDTTLQQMTKNALALADTFEFDVGESTQAAGNLIKTGLAKDGTEAFDLLTKAAQSMPPALREELPALTNEYGEFFDQLGFTGPQMFGVLAQAAKDPTFELDKLGDAFKEFTLRLADTSAVEQPLKTLGLNVKDIQKLVNTGQGTKAFDQVTDALKKVDDQTQRTSLQAALFGGPGEDMGNNLLKIDVGAAAAASGMDKAAGSAKSVTDSMQASPGQQMDSIMRTLSTTLGQTLAPVLQAVSGFLADNQGLISAITPVVLAIAAALGVWAAIQWVLNSALLANPITWIIIGIVALIAIVVVIATKTTWFQTIWSVTWGAIKGAALAVGRWFTGTLWPWMRDVWNKISGSVIDMKNKIVRLWNDLISFVTGIPGRIRSAASGMWDGVKDAFRSAINWLIGKWNGLSFGIPAITIPFVGTVGGGRFTVPQIPYLAQGGVVPATPGGTLAMLGEGGKPEAVMSLDHLDGMLRSVAGAVRGTSDGGGTNRLVIDVTGADSNFKKLIRNMVRIDGRGSAEKTFSTT